MIVFLHNDIVVKMIGGFFIGMGNIVSLDYGINILKRVSSNKL